MSDSDSELLKTNNDLFTFQNESTILNARGPNINEVLSFRQNMTSNKNMPRNYEWQRRPKSHYDQFDQRSMGYRRETSPMSVASACDARLRSNNNSYYARPMSSQRSVYNGRGGSPMSIRSIDSNATNVSAKDMVLGFKNFQSFSKYDQRMIQMAYNKLIKQKARRRVEKRRNQRQFLKGYRRKSGNDSGELGSNSSISSDDNRSMRSTRTLHSTIPNSMPPPVQFNKTHSQSSMNQTTMTQKDRFKNGFLLPSQRFNRSVAATLIPENSEITYSSDVNTTNNTRNRGVIRANNPQEPNSDDEEIFSEVTAVEKPVRNQRKRSIDRVDDVVLPNKKRPKTASPCKNMKTSIKNSTIDKVVKDFEFAKPAFLVRKSAHMKVMKEKVISTSTNMNPVEKLICKSALPPIQNNEEQAEVHEKDENEKEENTELFTLSQNTTDVSLRPSFIKRKLFSQKMDVADKTDDIAANSPQNSVYHAIQKEKTKARKLVTSQFCLSRDIQTDDNNLLDLIHKIVPAERMNATNQTNKTVVQNKFEDIDNWDVTSIISLRHDNEDDLSDTFTDEDTVAGNGKVQSPMTVKKVHKSKSPNKNVQKTSPKKNKISPPKNKEKSPLKNIKKTSPDKVSKIVFAEKNGTPTKAVQKYIKSFWDTDFESETELTPSSWTKNKPELKEIKKPDPVQTEAHKAKFQGFSSMFSANKTVANNTIMMNNTADRFNNTKSLKLCSHRNSKPKKVTSETVTDNATHIEPISSNKTTKTKLTTCLDASELETSAAPVNNQNKKQLKTNHVKPKPVSKISPLKKGKAKANKENEPTKSTIDKVTRKKNSKQYKTITDENVKPPTGKVHNRTESKNQPITAQKKPESEESATLSSQSKIEPTKQTKNKESATLSSQSKIEPTKQTKNKESAANKKLDTVKPQENENSKSKKPVSNHVNTTISNSKNNNKSKKTKTTTTKLSDSTKIYEDSFTVTNNNSIRPVRSCRISKQNETLNSRKTNLNVTLRSMVEKSNNHVKNKATANITNNKKAHEGSTSDLSFSLAHKKPLRNINARLLKVNDIDTSDISFTITNDKGSSIRKKEISANFKIKQLQIDLTPFVKIPEFSKQRPVRSKLANKRYVS